MEIVRRTASMRQLARQARRNARRIALVPTMGYLHAGHIALVRRARALADLTVVSIFVNPTQFGPQEDFERYPRDLMRDADLCIAEGVDYLFVPEVAELYPVDPGTWVEVEELSHRIEGASRPGHFRGVATVVLKLLNVVGPDVALFGEKDAQQLAVIRRMVGELLLDVEIVGVPTVREDDGVALSSRNTLLNAEQRAAAKALPAAARAAQRAAESAKGDPEIVKRAARDVLEAERLLRVDYVELVDPQTFAPLQQLAGPALLLLAVLAGEIRLIDNARIQP